MILNREQIDECVGHDAPEDRPLMLDDALIATARAYHDLRDAVLALCDRYEHAEQWENPPSGQTVAAKFHGVVARVEES